MDHFKSFKWKHLLYIVVYAIFILVSQKSFAQGKRITMEFNKAQSQLVFNDIEKQTGYKFFYKTEQAAKFGAITVKAENEPLENILNTIFDNTAYIYQIIGKQIVIIDKPKSSLNNISGSVSDDTGEPLAGVAVLIKGSNKSVFSNVNGDFSIQASNNDVLIFNFLGMKTVEIPVANKSSVEIRMIPDINLLEEVVVTGYGDFKKSAYTGSATVVSTDKLKELPVISFTQMLEANVPGVTMSSNSGQPGSYTSMRVRGRGSINASNEPLYILDGVPVSSTNVSNDSNSSGGLGILATLNPADIESITVLKDAASASLYGARGANGVVIIKTKKGVKGKTLYSFKANLGVSDFATNYREIMSGQERRELLYEGFVNNYLEKGKTEEEAKTYADIQVENYASIPAGGYSDWRKELFKTGLQQNYDFSATGGSDNTHFITTLNYTNQEGVSIKSGFERFTGRFNINNVYKKFELGVNAIISLTKNNQTPEDGYYSSALYTSRYSLTPSDPIYNNDGTYNTDISLNGNYNPLMENTVNHYYTRLARTFASINAGYTFIDGLKLSTNFNTDYSYTKEFRYWSPLSHDGSKDGGDGRMGIYERLNFDSNTMLSYIKRFRNHNLNAAIAYEIQSKEFDNIYGRAIGYGQLVNDNLDNATTPKVVSQYKTSETMLSYVARVNYDYNDKYYASLSYRRDGSSRLSTDNRWDNFWAVSVSWRLMRENFMKPIKKWMTDMKIRASYGVNGNLPYSLYGFYGTYSTSGQYNGESTLIENSIANPNLSWEKNYALNLGLDLEFLGKINVTFDWYKRTTKDLLMSRAVNDITGFNTIIDNVGEMENKGFEVEVKSINIDKKDFMWTSSLNLSHNKNKILKLSDVDEIIDGRYIRKVGYSYSRIYLREYAGVDPETGKALYYKNTLNNDGTLSKETTTDPSKTERAILNDIYPKLTGGFINTFKYKSLSLSFNLSFSLGGYSYDDAMWMLQDDGYASVGNKSIALRKRWKKPGDKTDVPKYVSGYSYGGYYNSSRGIHSTDHIRLKNIILSVNAPQKWVEAIKFKSARIFLSGTNLLTFAAYDGYDPELSGVVYFNVPLLKTYALGIEFGF